MPAKPERLDLAGADILADEFARDHNRATDDPLIKAMRRQLKMAFGLATYRNRRDAEKRAMQPDLFQPATPPKAIAFQVPEWWSNIRKAEDVAND